MKFAPSFEEHIHRYAFAQRLAFKQDVLDLGCNIGFGGQVLSWVANSLTMADNNWKMLNIAKKIGGYYCPTDIRYCDLDKDFPPGQRGVITAFEVIEHVDDPDTLIRNIAAHLKPGGVLVFSVPHMLPDPLHKTLFDEEKIKALIGKYLDIKEFYRQDKKYLSGLPLYRDLVCYMGVAQKK